MSATPNNATYLFEKHKKSEHWWTSIFTLVLAHIASISGVSRLPVWKFRKDEKKWRYERQSEFFSFQGVKLSEIHVEAAIPDLFIEFTRNGPLHVQPDIIIKGDAEKTVTIIENKTQGTGIGRLDDEYIQARDALRGIGYNATAYLLISVGHPRNDIWNAVLQQGIPLLLWEDVLELIDSIDWLRDLFDKDLKQYYSNPTLSSPDW